MKTLVENTSQKSISLAVKFLSQGQVVAIPTETVYGLAGDCRNSEAIKKIFEAKGRPQDNPLIVHISNIDMLKDVAREIPKDAFALISHFWPGPLTLILKRGKLVCDDVCAGLDSVGIRMPDNEATLKIIEGANFPLAAPSANTSGKPSPTTAKAVFEDMNGKIPLIIDGGMSTAGVESTILSLLEDTPIMLRPGIVTKEQIENVLNKKIKISPAIKKDLREGEKVLSPGLKYKHYAPNAEIIILKGSFQKFKNYINSHIEPNLYALCFDGEEKYLPVSAICYGKENDFSTQAHNLFDCLRKLDKLGAKKVYARCPNDSGVGLAVFNRLVRAAGFKLIQL